MVSWWNDRRQLCNICVLESMSIHHIDQTLVHVWLIHYCHKKISISTLNQYGFRHWVLESKSSDFLLLCLPVVPHDSIKKILGIWAFLSDATISDCPILSDEWITYDGELDCVIQNFSNFDFLRFQIDGHFFEIRFYPIIIGGLFV